MAAERRLIVTDFDRIRVEAPFAVVVEAAANHGLRASGSSKAIERVSIAVQSRTLIIRMLQLNSGIPVGTDQGPVSISVATPQLISASLGGSGSLAVSMMRATRINLALSGAGTITVGAVEADVLNIDLQGSGTISLAGKALSANVSTSGSGNVSASNLATLDLKMTSQSSGNADIGAKRSAKIIAAGAGNITVLGVPACTVTSVGSGTVRCGKGAP